MLLRDSYLGGDSPFRGDRTIVLGGLPAGARVTSATVTVGPARVALEAGFEELFLFPGEVVSHSPSPLVAADWGVTATHPPQPSFVEVDLHARYELAKAIAAKTSLPLTGASLQIDVGGIYVDVSEQGTIKGPSDKPFSFQPDALPGITTSKFKLSAPDKGVGGGAQAQGVMALGAVGVRSVPTNVSVRIGAQAPFLPVLGPLASSRVSPDLTGPLNAFLATAHADGGHYAIPLTVHSDTIARLDLSVELTYVLTSSLLPAPLTQVTLPFDLSTRSAFASSVPAVRLPRDAAPVQGQTGAAIRGQFGPTRLALSYPADGVSAIVSTRTALAQPFALDADATALGFDLRLQSHHPGKASLSFAIRPDEGGAPSPQIIGQVASLSVGGTLPGQSGWIGVNLPAPVHLQGGARYWLVLQSLDADAEWSAAEPPPAGQLPLLSSQDGGLSWRPAVTEQTIRPVQAALHVREQPEQFSIPIALQIGSGSNVVQRTLQEFAPLGRTEFSFDFAQQLQSYLGEAPARCKTGELIVNGDFTEPPTDDATLRLLGNPVEKDRRLVGSVDLSGGADLSVQHYLTLDNLRSGEPLKIDCAGVNPASTQLAEVVGAINGATRAVVAGGTRYLELAPGQWTPQRYWLEDQAPASWSGNPGQIYRVGLATGQGLVFAVLADPDLIPARSPQPRGVGGAPPPSEALSQPAVMTQQVGVGGGCRYRLQATFGFSRPARGRGAASGAAVAPGAAVTPTPAVTPTTNPALLPRWEVRWLDATGAELGSDSAPLPVPATQARLTRAGGPLAADQLLDASVAAPARAAAAQVGFVHPLSDEYALFFEQVSFKATTEQLANPELSQWARSAPQGWTVESGVIAAIVDAVGEPAGVTLHGDGPSDTVLTQTVAVDAGAAYTLTLRAQATEPAGAAARAEIRWLATGQALSTTTVTLDVHEFSERAWSGEAPADATAAQLRLVQPRDGGTLSITEARLPKPDIVEVPLEFTSETPGQLTVSSFQLAYDLPGPASSLSLNARQAAADRTLALPGSLVAAPEGPAGSEAALQTVPGIGPARARRLTDAGIASLALLAAATPEAVSQALPGIAPDVAASFVGAAQERLSG